MDRAAPGADSDATHAAATGSPPTPEADSDPRDCDRLEGVSLTESVYNYPKENGRTYHAYHAGSYFLPNDQMELERLDAQHDIVKLLLGGRNYLAPWTASRPPTRILDVGTGTGRWAVEMGDAFPAAAVVGVDLSPVQPTLVPPNVAFFVEDAADDDWAGDAPDYVHTRFTVGCWRRFETDIVARAFAHLRPGGWLECQEPDVRVACDDGSLAAAGPALAAWCRDLADAARAARRPLDAAARLRAAFEAAGFVDVAERVFRLPVNGWPAPPRLRQLGRLWQANLQSGLQAFTYAYMHRVRGRSKAQIEVSLVDVRKDIANPHVHAYHRFHVVCGRKPEAAAAASGASALLTPTPTQTGAESSHDVDDK